MADVEWTLTRDGEHVTFTPHYYGPRDRPPKQQAVVIAGADTESATCTLCGRYETISVQAAVIEADPRRQKPPVTAWTKCGESSLAVLIRLLIPLVGRKKRPVYVGVHNLGYDLGQMLKDDLQGWLLLRAGSPAGEREPWLYKDLGFCELEIRQCVPNSSSPYAEIVVYWGVKTAKTLKGKEAENWQLRRLGKATAETVEGHEWGRKVTLHLRDTWAWTRSSLDAACKSFKIPTPKMTRPPGIGAVDYRPHTTDPQLKRQLVSWLKESPPPTPLPDDATEYERDDYEKKMAEREKAEQFKFLTGAQIRAYFEKYGATDALAVAQLLDRLWELQAHYGATRPSVSAPAFAASRVREEGRVHGLYLGMGGQEAVQAAVDAYRGGRLGSIIRGRLTGLSIFDIQSSYPYAMLHLPSFSRDYGGCYQLTEQETPDAYTRTSAALSMAETYPCTILEVSGYEHNRTYPAFLHRQTIVTRDGRSKTVLTPQAGEIRRLWVTGAELLAALAGGFELQEVHTAYSWFDTEPGHSPFQGFVQRFYHEKQNRPKDDPAREMAKLALNALYGKLIELRRPELLGLVMGDLDARAFVAVPVDRESWAGRYYWRTIWQELSLAAKEHDELEPLGERIAQALAVASEQLERELTEKGEPFEILPVGEIPLNDGEFGATACPPAAATVTGIARARLLIAMRALSAVYWATDSVFAPITEEGARELLAAVPEHVDTPWGSFRILPAGVNLPQLGQEIGDLGTEAAGLTGVIAGPGRYWLAGEGRPKIAFHGLPHLDRRDPITVRHVLTELAEGRSVTYQMKTHPVKARSTSLGGKTKPEEIGRFIGGSVEVSPEADDRLVWSELPAGGFVGRYLTQEELLAAYYSYQEQKERKAWSLEFRRRWLREIGRIEVSDRDRDQVPRWARSARGKGKALDLLLGKIDDTSPLAVLGDMLPGIPETEDELLQILVKASPA